MGLLLDMLASDGSPIILLFSLTQNILCFFFIFTFNSTYSIEKSIIVLNIYVLQNIF